MVVIEEVGWGKGKGKVVEVGNDVVVGNNSSELREDWEEREEEGDVVMEAVEEAWLRRRRGIVP